MYSADWCSSVEVLTITRHHPQPPRGLHTKYPAPSRLVLHHSPHPFSPGRAHDKPRHPRAHSTAEPPHSMPNWVVKRSRANDTRTAGSRKSRSARGFFLYTHRCPRAASRGSSSAGRALPCQGRCREFESRLPLHIRPHLDRAWGRFCCAS